MADRLVINTGPLVVLARAKMLDVAGQLPIDFICPEQVREEIAAGVSRGCPDVAPDWLQTVALRAPLHPLARASLDAGEAAVIQLATEQGIGRVCIDERKGRRVGRAVGLQVIGSLGLLARAKVLGLIPALRPVIEELLAKGAYYHPDIVDRVLANADE